MDNFTLHPELKRLLRALELCSDFGLYFARCNTVSLRNELVSSLKNNLNKPIIELSLNPKNDSFIDAQLAELLVNASDDTVVFIYDLEKLFYLKDRHVIQELNWRRGEYGRLNHPVVFWLPEFLLNEILNDAPDFSDWYSGIYEFSLSQPEQQNLMTNTWQTANENFVGQLSLQEKERWISNLQNLLSELDGEQSKTKADLLNRLGELYHSLGKYDKALACYQQNLPVQQALGDKEGESATLNNISLIYDAKGDYDTAFNYLIQSVIHELNNEQGKNFYNHLATSAFERRNYETALSYLTQSLKIQQAIGDKQGEGATLNNISQIYHAKGDYDTALSYLTQSLKIQQAIGDKQGEGATLNNISQIYRAKGDYDTALMYLSQSLKIRQYIGDTAGLCVTLINMGRIHRQNDQREQAMATWLQAYNIAKKIGLAQALANLEDLAKQLSCEGLAYWEALSQSTAKHSDD